MNDADVAGVVRVEVKRLQASPSDAARWASEHWWLRRLLATTAHPGSAQHAIASGVIHSLTPQQFEAHLRASAPRRGDAS